MHSFTKIVIPEFSIERNIKNPNNCTKTHNILHVIQLKAQKIHIQTQIASGKKKSQPFHNDHQFQKEFKIGNHVGSLNRVGSNMYMKKNEPESDIWWLSMPRKSDRRPEICKRVRVWISDFP